MDVPGSKRYSKTWKYFTIKGNNDDTARCKICNNDYSYKSSISNLTKHLRKRHNTNLNNDTFDTTDTSDENSNHSDEDLKISPLSNGTESKSTWQYFDILDSNKFEAKCKICEKEISYDSISDLTKHVKEHDVTVSDDDGIDDSVLDADKLKLLDCNIFRKKSAVWKYMEVIGDKFAACIICRKKLSYATTISNLKKHMRRLHPDIDIAEGESKVIVSANGKLYEVQTSDVEKDPIETNEVYLDSDFPNEENETKESRKSVKKIFNKYNKVRSENKFKKEVEQRRRRSASSDIDIISSRKNGQDFKKDTIDFFGSYIMSMLRELPKQVSDQLQGEIVKQIISAKVTCENQHSKLDKPVIISRSNVRDILIPPVITENNNITDIEMTDDK